MKADTSSSRAGCEALADITSKVPISSLADTANEVGGIGMVGVPENSHNNCCKTLTVHNQKLCMLHTLCDVNFTPSPAKCSPLHNGSIF